MLVPRFDSSGLFLGYEKWRGNCHNGTAVMASWHGRPPFDVDTREFDQLLDLTRAVDRLAENTCRGMEACVSQDMNTTLTAFKVSMILVIKRGVVP